MIQQQISTRSIARIAAIQVLYQFADSKKLSDINSLLLNIKNFYQDLDFKNDHDIDEKNKLKIKPSNKYLIDLVQYTHNNLSKIDIEISKLLTKSWTINKLPILLHALLRVGISELSYFFDTPEKVIINEYTDIANNMLDKNEIGFVNCILHNYAQLKR